MTLSPIRRRFPGRALLLTTAVSMAMGGLAAPPALVAGELYQTDFDDFPAGPDQLVGTDGWVGTNEGEGVHGIDDEIVTGLGRSGFIGGNAVPSTGRVIVWRPVSIDPVADGTPIVDLYAVVGVQDSVPAEPASPRDAFFVSFYNRSNELLGSINFDNAEATFGLWRFDGAEFHGTGFGFVRGKAQELFVRIDFAANRWSASIDGVPIFVDQPFNATGGTLDLETVALEWQVLGATSGNNWMLFDDWAIVSRAGDPPLPDSGPPFAVEAIGINGSGHPVLAWTGEPGHVYQVEFSADLVTWRNDLPGSRIEVTRSVPAPVYFTDTSTASGDTHRYYRVTRAPLP